MYSTLPLLLILPLGELTKLYFYITCALSSIKHLVVQIKIDKPSSFRTCSFSSFSFFKNRTIKHSNAVLSRSQRSSIFYLITSGSIYFCLDCGHSAVASRIRFKFLGRVKFDLAMRNLSQRVTSARMPQPVLIVLGVSGTWVDKVWWTATL